MHARGAACAAQRDAHQPLRAHHKSCQNANDLAREAVGCMGVFGRSRGQVLVSVRAFW